MKSKVGFLSGLILAVIMQLGVPAARPQAQEAQAVSYFSLGLKEKEPQKKIAAYARAIELDPQFVEALYNISLAYVQLQDFARAESFLLRALNARPQRLKNESKLQVIYELARVQGRLGKIKEQENHLRRAKELARDQTVRATILWELGNLLYAQGRLNEALNEIKEGQGLASDKAGSFASLGEKIAGELELQKLYQQAQQAKSAGDWVSASNYLRQIQRRQASYKDAAKLLAEAEAQMEAEAKKQTHAVWYEQAQKYAASGNVAMAMASYEALLQEAGDYRDARAQWQALRDQAEQKKAIDKLEAEYETGRAAFGAKDWKRAIAAFEKVMAGNGDFRDTARRLREARNALERENTEQALAHNAAAGAVAPRQVDLGRVLPAQENENSQAQPTPVAAAHLDSLYQAAVRAQGEKNWLRALIDLEKIRLLQPDYRDATARLQQVRQQQQQAALAVHSRKAEPAWLSVAGVTAMIVIVPVLGFIAFSPAVRARYCMLRSDYAAAARIYEKILARSPQRTKIYPTLSTLYLLLGRRDDRALKIFKTVLQLNLDTPHREQINAIVAEHFLTEGRTDSDAIAVLESALAVERKRLKD